MFLPPVHTPCASRGSRWVKGEEGLIWWKTRQGFTQHGEQTERTQTWSRPARLT